MNITTNTQLLTSSYAFAKPATSTNSSDFKQLIDNNPASKAQKLNLEQALNDFYQIHQRSQITGVPTSEYNQAVKALGLDPDKDPLAGIKLLEQSGFKTGAPTIGAILEYGGKPQAYGNQSYLAQAHAIGEDKVLPNHEAIIEEMNQLNAQHNQLLGSASNYFEAVQALVSQTNITPYQNMTLAEALPLILSATSQGQTTLDWLKNRDY
jgi:hypothetical protein